MDFQIPNAKVFFSLSKDISSYKINIDIKSNQIKQNIIEVLTSLNLRPKKEIVDKINTKIVLATIIEMDSQKIEKTEIEKIVLIDVPSQIYGEIRKIFISLFESSGFKDIKINEKVDFKKLYELKKMEPLVVFCRSGNRSEQVMHYLRKQGIEEVWNGGGWVELNAELNQR